MNRTEDGHVQVVPGLHRVAPEDPRVIAAVDEYLVALEAGQVPDRFKFLSRYPAEVAAALGDCLDAVELVRAAGPELESRSAGRPAALGDFRLVREVGRGGMGVVYEAEQISLQRRVALKVLSLAGGLDSRQLQRFRIEVQAAAGLHHSNIAPVYAVGCERGIHFYAMQFIDGPSLAAVIDNLREPARAAPAAASTRPEAVLSTASPADSRERFLTAARLGIEAADALDHAHQQGVVHRDVKPANLLLDSTGRLWVVDFGLARLQRDAGPTLTGDLVGTLRYMSPEQALARRTIVDHRTDIYSLGVTLYELLTLTPAFPGEERPALLRQIAEEEPPAPRRLAPAVPADLETVILKAMAKEPAERYATAKDFADDLRRFLEDRPIEARRPHLGQRCRRWGRRHRPLVAALATSAAVLVVVLVLGLVGYAAQQRQLVEDKARATREVEGKLYDTLLKHAQSVRLARRPGYRAEVWDDLHQAVRLDVPARNPEAIAAEALACLGDPIGLNPVADPTAVPRRKLPGLPAGFEQKVRAGAAGGAIAVVPDADLVAVAGRTGGVALFSREGKRLRHEGSPLGGIYDLVLAADGKLLVAGCEEGFVTWDLAGSDRWVVRAGNVFSVAVCPNRRLLASGGRKIELWSLITKRLLATFPPAAAGARVEFSEDGRALLAVVNGTPVAGWPVSGTPERRVLDGHTAGVPAIAFSPDGQQLASVSKDRTVRLWEAATGRPLRTLTGHAGEIEAVAFNPDGSLLATGDLAGPLRVWDARSGDLLADIGRGELPDQIWRLQFSPGGEYLAAAGGNIAVWTVQKASAQVSLKPLCTLTMPPGKAGVIDLAAMPGGTELVCLDRDGGLYSYDLARADTLQPLANARVGLRSLHFTPAGDRLTLLTRNGTLAVRDWQTKSTADTHRRAESVAVSADGRWAAVVEAGHSVAVVELASGREVLALPPEGSEVWSLAWSPDGRKLALGLSDGTVTVWDLEQVRARLAEFGLDSPSTVRPEEAHTLAPVPGFDRVVRVNRLRTEAEQARRLATTARDAGDYAAERDQLLAGLEREKRLAETVPDAPAHRKRVAWTHATLACPLARLGQTKAALAHLEMAAELLNRLTLDDPGCREYRRHCAYELGMRAQVLEWAGKRDEAIDAARQAVTVREELATDPGSPSDRIQLVVAHHNHGFLLFKAGKKDEAEQWYNTALAAGDQATHNHPVVAEDSLFRSNRAATFHYLGVLRHQAGDAAGAVKRFREAAPLRARLAGDYPQSVEYASETGLTLDWLGVGLRDLGQLDESAQRFREAARWQRAAFGLRPNRGIRDLCRRHQTNLATTLLRLGRHVDAASAARALPRLAPRDPATLLRAARLLARCVPIAERDSGLPFALGPLLAWAYRGEALALVRAAVANGLTDTTPLLSDVDFEPLRDCDEFRRLQGRLAPTKK
jgi:WD40 repeat protein/tetratricopeptide (TPR) repeat protein